MAPRLKIAQQYGLKDPITLKHEPIEPEGRGLGVLDLGRWGVLFRV